MDDVNWYYFATARRAPILAALRRGGALGVLG